MSFYVCCCVTLCLMCVQIASSRYCNCYSKEAKEREDYPISNYIVGLAENEFRTDDEALRFDVIKEVIDRKHMDSSLFDIVFDNFDDEDELLIRGLFNNQYKLMKNDENILKAKLSEKSKDNNDNNNDDGIVKLQHAKEAFLRSKLFRGKLTEEALNKIINECKVENDNINYKDMIKTITDGFVYEELYSIWLKESTDNTLTTPTQS
ncbi:uncharacterized protein LOC126900730 [Daktulosphaira vitifoliae]|uniref:uncharacterized protein LOC126900730 n=1 Tax=Daktulosphaira vitifoliae TaxID=58002 RepID=UPI0021AA8FA4|nr:uncharacterized protein LOC126900730 [Daktulosphaira vitifoliae]